MFVVSLTQEERRRRQSALQDARDAAAEADAVAMAAAISLREAGGTGDTSMHEDLSTPRDLPAGRGRPEQAVKFAQRGASQMQAALEQRKQDGVDAMPTSLSAKGASTVSESSGAADVVVIGGRSTSRQTRQTPAGTTTTSRTGTSALRIQGSRSTPATHASKKVTGGSATAQLPARRASACAPFDAPSDNAAVDFPSDDGDITDTVAPSPPGTPPAATKTQRESTSRGRSLATKGRDLASKSPSKGHRSEDVDPIEQTLAQRALNSADKKARAQGTAVRPAEAAVGQRPKAKAQGRKKGSAADDRRTPDGIRDHQDDEAYPTGTDVMPAGWVERLRNASWSPEDDEACPTGTDLMTAGRAQPSRRAEPGRTASTPTGTSGGTRRKRRRSVVAAAVENALGALRLKMACIVEDPRLTEAMEEFDAATHQVTHLSNPLVAWGYQQLPGSILMSFTVLNYHKLCCG